MIDDALVVALLEISNNDKVIKMVEPSLMWHSKIEEWMIVRIFKAIELLQEAYELRGTNTEGTGTLPSKEQRLHKRGKSVRKLRKSVKHSVPVSKVKSS